MPGFIQYFGIDPEERTLVDWILSRRGFEIHYSDNLARMQRDVQDNPPDLIILDTPLPDDETFGICRALRSDEATAHVPVLIMGECHSGEWMAEAVAAGADGCVPKPVVPGELLAKVHAITRRNRARERRSGVSPGDLFAKRYEITGRLDRAGNDSSFFGTDTHSPEGHRVEIRIFPGAGSSVESRDCMTAVLREAYLLARLDHTNIAAFHDFGHTDSHYYLVTEYLCGNTLQDLLIVDGRINEGVAVVIARRVAETLAYLEAQGIFHRRICPETIVLTERDGVKLIGFGSACSIEDGQLTPGKVEERNVFTAPELLCDDGLADSSAAVYALGITLYQATTQSVPSFTHPRGAAAPPAPPVSQLNPEISGVLSDLIMSMIAPESSQRPTPVAILDSVDSSWYTAPENVAESVGASYPDVAVVA